MVGLRKIFNSMRDGMSTAADWFEMPVEEPKKSGTDAAKEALKKKAGKDKATVEIVEPEPSQEVATPVEIACPNREGDMVTVESCNSKCESRDGCPAHT
jgi:hypothetical protein